VLVVREVHSEPGIGHSNVVNPGGGELDEVRHLHDVDVVVEIELVHR
jgi:hypothetical protein